MSDMTMEGKDNKEDKIQLDIPWLQQQSKHESTPPDPDFIAMLEELEYR